MVLVPSTPRRRALTGFLVLSVFASTDVAAQSPCFLPDQLDSAPCCAPVGLALPPLGPSLMPALGLCWSACNPPAQNCLVVDWDPIQPTAVCGHYVTKLRVGDCSGQLLMSGQLELDYTRTWEETTTPGTVDTQVWRFLAKIDLGGNFSATPVCPVPPDLGPYPSSFWYGYFDVAENCSSGTVENALVLFHGCDAFTHAPTLSSQPGVFHPTTTFAIVAPNTANNPFTPVAAPLFGGPIQGEGMRRVDATALTCLAEEPISAGALLPLGLGCLCPLSLAPAQNTASTLVGAGQCGSSFQSLNFFPTAPWIDFVSTSIGAWTNGTSYPGPERVSVGEGLFLYRDACDPSGAFAPSLDLFYGAATEGGYLVLTPTATGLFSDRFLDLASNYSAPLPGPITFPLLGSVAPTEHLIYLSF